MPDMPDMPDTPDTPDMLAASASRPAGRTAMSVKVPDTPDRLAARRVATSAAVRQANAATRWDVTCGYPTRGAF